MRFSLVFVIAAIGCAQTAPEPVKLGDVTVSGSIRSRIEAWDWFEADANNDYAFSGTFMRLGFGQQKKSFDWQLDFAAPVMLGLPDDAIAPGNQGQLGGGANYFAANDLQRNVRMVFVKQGFIRFKREKQSLKIGRMEFNDGAEVTPKDPTLAALKRDRIAQRLLGIVGFSHVARSFDGLQYVVAGKDLNLTVMAVRPTRGVNQVDGWGEVNVNVGYGALTGQVSGKRGAGEWRAFGLFYNDSRDVLKVDNRPVALRRADILQNINIMTFGGHYLHSRPTRAGNIDALVWGAGQVGTWGALDQRSGALMVEFGWQPPNMNAVRPWLRGGYDYGSGDNDPNDNTHGTFFQVLPTPRIHAKFPFFNMMNLRNSFGSLLLRPGRALTIQAEVHSLILDSSRDLWYTGGGAFQPWTFGYQGRTVNGHKGLATMYDLGADYNVNAGLTLGGYIGHASGGAVIDSIYPRGNNGNFGYLEFTYRF